MSTVTPTVPPCGVAVSMPRPTSTRQSTTNEISDNDHSVFTCFDRRYEKIRTLGKGNFGKVYLAKDDDTGEEIAIKVVDKTSFRSNDQRQHATNEKAICERFSSRLKHKNIVRVHWVASDNESVYVAMEYIEGGELFEKIKQKHRLEEPLARRWFREIIEAVHYIHQNGIVHRDLKPENVLIDRHHHIRICDFGFGKFCERQQVLNTYCGSPFYAAPEMVTATPYRGPPVDMWSCGVILYAMLAGTLPFQGEDMPQLFRRINNATFSIPGYISKEAADLIRQLLSKNPRHRITAEACLRHPWLNNGQQSLAALTTTSSGALRSVHTNIKPSKAKKLLPHASAVPPPPQDQKIKTKASRLLAKMVFIHKKVVPQQKEPGSNKSTEDGGGDTPPKMTVRQGVAYQVKGLLKTAFRRRITQDDCME